METHRRFGLVSCVVLLAMSIAIGFAAYHTPPSRFDPIGSGRIPLVVCILLALLALAQGARTMLRLDPEDGEAAEPAITIKGQSALVWIVQSLLVAGLTVGFVAVLGRRVMPFVPLSAAYVIAVGIVLSYGAFSLSRLLLLVITGAVLAFGSGYLFTQILYIRLP